MTSASALDMVFPPKENEDHPDVVAAHTLLREAHTQYQATLTALPPVDIEVPIWKRHRDEVGLMVLGALVTLVSAHFLSALVASTQPETIVQVALYVCQAAALFCAIMGAMGLAFVHYELLSRVRLAIEKGARWGVSRRERIQDLVGGRAEAAALNDYAGNCDLSIWVFCSLWGRDRSKHVGFWTRVPSREELAVARATLVHSFGRALPDAEAPRAQVVAAAALYKLLYGEVPTLSTATPTSTRTASLFPLGMDNRHLYAEAKASDVESHPGSSIPFGIVRDGATYVWHEGKEGHSGTFVKQAPSGSGKV